MSKNTTKDMIFRLQDILPKKFSELKTGEELLLWINYHDINQETFNNICKDRYKVHHETLGIPFHKDEWINDSWVKFDINQYNLIYCIEHGVFIGYKHDIDEIYIIDFSSIITEIIHANGLFDWDNYDIKGLLEADIALGYYRLCKCPEGVTPNPVPEVRK